MHMLNSFYKLVHVVLYSLLWQVIGSALDRLIHVLFHELEYQGESACWLIIKYFNKLNNVWVRVQPLESLDLTQVINLINTIEVTLHTFYGHVLAVAKRLRFKYLRECTFA